MYERQREERGSEEYHVGVDEWTHATRFKTDAWVVDTESGKENTWQRSSARHDAEKSCEDVRRTCTTHFVFAERESSVERETGDTVYTRGGRAEEGSSAGGWQRLANARPTLARVLRLSSQAPVTLGHCASHTCHPAPLATWIAVSRPVLRSHSHTHIHLLVVSSSPAPRA